MTVRMALPGLVLGALGLAAGAVAVTSSEPAFGVVAGVLALAAGATNLVLARRLQDQTAAQSLLEDELRVRRASSTAETGAPTADDQRPATSRASAPTGPDSEPGQLTDTDGEHQPATLDQAAVGRPTGEALVDQSTGLFSENFFLVALDSRIAAARRHLRPVAMVLLEVVEGLSSNRPSAVDAGLVAETIKATLREADTACRLHNGYFALLLEDTPENGAIWTVERIRRQLLESEKGLTVWAGVACYPAHAFSPEKILEASEQALVSAREWRQDRIEIAATTD